MVTSSSPQTGAVAIGPARIGEITVVAAQAGPVEDPAEAFGPVEGVAVRRLRLPAGRPATWPAKLASALPRGGPGPMVVWAASPELVPALWDHAQTRDDCLVVTTRRAAGGAIRALRTGRTLASLVYPPLPTPRQALEQAGSAPTTGERCDVTVLEEPGPDRSAGDAPWLAFTRTGVAVRLSALTPLERAATLERRGPVRPAGGHLLIGRANYSGQGRAWAQAVQDHVPGFTAANIAARVGGRPREFLADHLTLAHERGEPMVRLDLALEFGAPATHVLMEDFQSLFGMSQARAPSPSFEDAKREVDQLMEAGKQVGILVHGTAGRTPETHLSMYPWSPYHDPDSKLTSVDRELAAGVHAAWEAVRDRGIPLFVATPDMLDYFPDGVWLPIVADRAFFEPAPPWAPGDRLRVAHIPSSDVKKGSDLVDVQLRELDSKGVIEYVSLRAVPALSMPGVLRGVDVVVDQVVLGNPATLLAETMATGRLGVAHVAAHVRRRFPEPLPVVEADGLTIGEAVAEIAADPERFRPLAEAGPGFARRHQDGRLSAQVLVRHFLTPEAS